MLESDPADSSDEDCYPIPHMPPRAHNREASGSSLAPPQPTPTDPTLIAILDRMQQEQTRQAQATATVLAQMQACQDQFQQQ
jgi:hypothetical protein